MSHGPSTVTANPDRILLMTVGEFGIARYLLGAYLGRAVSGYSHLHEHTGSEEKQAIEFCTQHAAQALADTLNAHKNHVWNVIRVKRNDG